MRNPLPQDWRHRLRIRLLALDSRIDAAVYAAGRVLGAAWGGLVETSRMMQVRGLRRFAVDILCETLTWGTVAGVLMLALAQPAFQATKQDWRARAELAVTFLDRNGREVGKRGVLQTDSVALDQLPDYLIKSVLAIEDRRFYSHFGVDIIGTVRALLEDARAHQVVEGGSTLTQQLAKNLFLSNERTIDRKVKEAFLAIWLETNLSKNEILKLYLDHGYLGAGTFGVEAASQYYFGKSARDLTLAEAAMIAGMFKAPTKYAPTVNLPAARARAAMVLDALVDAGFMTEGQVHAARLHPATPVPRARDTSPDYYLDWAYQEVRQLADSGAFGAARSLVVKTTLDPTIQKDVEQAIENGLRQYGEQYQVTQSAAVVMTPQGAVRAMVGGRDYGESQFNRATEALRQPGSSFKPYVYATALENGFTPQTIVLDAPITIGRWSPHNYGDHYFGRVTVMTALQHSLNTVAVRLAQAVGRDKIIATAKRMGVRTPLRNILQLPLGVSEVTVLDQATGYAAFANGGHRVVPYAVLEVSDSRGNVVWHHPDAALPEALPPDIVAEMNTMLVNVVEHGTGTRARLEGLRVGGKTGTTQDYRDGWFVGFTGDLTCAVWFGNDDYTPTRTMTGGTLPAMTWHEIMTGAEQTIAQHRLLYGVPPPPGAEPAMAAADAPHSEGPPRLGSRPVAVLDDSARAMRPAAGGGAAMLAP
ncbi:MAG TPA: penicillin-binding protein 1A, partial [Hyphomicrobiales bacterium]|nr:penicillin-binding protein 1A [Hyphomicrobiales bacterium]